MATLQVMLTTPCFTLAEFLAAVFMLCYVAPRAVDWCVRRVGV